MLDGITLKQLLMYQYMYNSIVIASNQYEKSETASNQKKFKNSWQLYA